MNLPRFIVVVSGIGRSEGVFSTFRSQEAVMAIAALANILPNCDASIYADSACVLRVQGDRWTVPTAQKAEAA